MKEKTVKEDERRMSYQYKINPNYYLIIARLLFYITALGASFAFWFLFPVLGIFDESRTSVIAIPVSATALVGDLIVFFLLERLFQKLERASKVEDFDIRVRTLMTAKQDIIKWYFPLVYLVVFAAAISGVVSLVIQHHDIFSSIIGASLASIAYILNLHLPAFFTINYLLESYVSRQINEELSSTTEKALQPQTIAALNNFSFRQRHLVIGVLMPLMLFSLTYIMILKVKTLTMINYLTLGFFYLLYLITLQLYFFQTNGSLQDFTNALKTISLGTIEQTMFQPLPIKSTDDIAEASGHYNNIILKLRKSLKTQSEVAHQLQSLVVEYQTQFTSLSKLANAIATASTEFITIMQENAEKSSEMVKQLESVRMTLNDFSRRVEELTSTVEETAEQVRILSFNAQLEAVRVSAAASAEPFMVISQSISDLYREMENNDVLIKELVDQFKEHVMDVIASLMEAAEKSKTSMEQAVTQTHEINASIEEETALIEELHAQTEHLSDLAKVLENLITLFSSSAS